MRLVVLWLVSCSLIFGLEGLAGYFKTKNKLVSWKLVGISKYLENGLRVKVCGVKIRRCVKVRIIRREYNGDELVRLSKRAFLELAPLKAGLVKVKVKKIRRVNIDDSRKNEKDKVIDIKFRFKFDKIFKRK